jgi:hypothetical protein
MHNNPLEDRLDYTANTLLKISGEDDSPDPDYLRDFRLDEMMCRETVK